MLSSAGRGSMIDHLSTYATDYAATRSFYEVALGALGYHVQMELTAEWNEDFPTQRMCAFGPAGRPVFWIIETREPATPRHFAFRAESRLIQTARENAKPTSTSLYEIPRVAGSR